MDPVGQVAAPVEAAPQTQEQGQAPDAGPLDGLTQGQALYKIVVDGQEEEYDIDTLKKMATHGKGADKRMSEAGKLKSDATRLLDLLRQDPIAVRKELDKDWNEKDFLANRLADIMNEEMLTPEQRQALQDANELKEYRSKKQKEQDAVQEQHMVQQMNVEIGKLDVEFAEAFNEVGLPKTDTARRRLAAVMLEAAENGQHIPTKVLAKHVKDEMHNELMELLKTSDDDMFESLLGSDLLTKAQKISLKKVKVPGNRTTPSQRQNLDRDEPAPKKPRTAEDFLREQGIF